MLEKIKSIFKGIFIALDSFELVIAVILATVLFFSIPCYLIKRFYEEGHLVLSIFISALLISSFGFCIRDFKRKKWSPLSVLTSILWGICFLVVAWEMAT